MGELRQIIAVVGEEIISLEPFWQKNSVVGHRYKQKIKLDKISKKHGNALKCDNQIHYIVENHSLCTKTRDLAILEILDNVESCKWDPTSEKYFLYNAYGDRLRVSTVQQSWVCSHTRTTSLYLQATLTHFIRRLRVPSCIISHSAHT